MKCESGGAMMVQYVTGARDHWVSVVVSYLRRMGSSSKNCDIVQTVFWSDGECDNMASDT